MSIVSGDLLNYGCASLPTDDVSLTGGAIDPTRRGVFTQLTANAIIAAVSSGSDTRTVTITGRNPTGAVVTDGGALTGTTEKDFTITFERIQSIVLSATSGTATVTIKQGVGGTTIATIPPNEIGFYALFQNAASGSSPIARYEKMFWKNATASGLTLTSSIVTLTADPALKITMGIGTIGGTATVANRTTAPSGVTFVGLNTAQPVGSLAPAAAIEVWIKQSLAANDSAQRNTFTTSLAGSST